MEIYPWALGSDSWRSRVKGFLLDRNHFLQRMKFRAVVSNKTCEEVYRSVRNTFESMRVYSTNGYSDRSVLFWTHWIWNLFSICSAFLICLFISKVFELFPKHPVWQRQRNENHGGAIRFDQQLCVDDEDDVFVPSQNQMKCKVCLQDGRTAKYSKNTFARGICCYLYTFFKIMKISKAIVAVFLVLDSWRKNYSFWLFGYCAEC